MSLQLLAEQLVLQRRICRDDKGLEAARSWFRRHGLDWQDFVANGIEAALLEATGDALAFRVTALARKREGCEPCGGYEPREGYESSEGCKPGADHEANNGR